MLIEETSGLIQAKHDLIRKDCQQAYGSAIADLEHEIRAKIDARLSNVESKADIQRQAIQRIPEIPSLRQQYKESIRIYRSLLGLVLDMRQIKKDIREKLGIGGKNDE